MEKIDYFFTIILEMNSREYIKRVKEGEALFKIAQAMVFYPFEEIHVYHGYNDVNLNKIHMGLNADGFPLKILHQSSDWKITQLIFESIAELIEAFERDNIEQVDIISKKISSIILNGFNNSTTSCMSKDIENPSKTHN